MKIRRVIILLVLAFTLGGGAYAQENILDFRVGARNASLANANIAEATDVSVMYENPAGLAFIDDRSLLIEHSQGSGSRGMQENIAVPLFLKSPVAVSLGLDAYHLDYLLVGNTQHDLLEYGYDVAFASAVVPTLSIGGSATLRQNIQNGGWFQNGTRQWGANFSIGAVYAPTPGISYGILYGGLGSGSFYSRSDSAMVSASTALPRTLEVGATMEYPSPSSFRPAFLVLSLVNEKIFGIKGLYYKGGIEIRPYQFIDLRFGYLAGPGEFSARYGIGFHWNIYGLQYAIYPQHNTHILFQQISASMGF